MGVTINPDLLKIIEDEVESGRSNGVDDFLDKAVHHYLVSRAFEESYTPEEIREKIIRGLGQLDRGEGFPAEEAFRRLRVHAAEQRRKLG
jgi:Arc/MetJ-type ribon-helix-helix transcriptional regulator